MRELLYLTLFLGLIPATLAYFKNFRIGSILPFVLLMAASVVYEVIFSLFLKIESAVWFLIYDLLEFFTVLYYFYKLSFRKHKILSLIFFLLFVAAQISVLIFGYDKTFFAKNITLFFLNSMVCIFTILWFWEIFLKMEVQTLWKIPDFYYISGLFIYHSTTFLLFLLSDYILNSSGEQLADYWILNILATFLLRSFLILGIWKTSHK